MTNFTDLIDRNVTTDADFEELGRMLEEGRSSGSELYFTYALPETCSPQQASVAFGCEGRRGVYLRFERAVRYTGPDERFAALCRGDKLSAPGVDMLRDSLRGMNVDGSRQPAQPVQPRREGRERAGREQTPELRTDRSRLNLRSEADQIIRLDADRLLADLSREVKGQQETLKELVRYAVTSAAKVNPKRPVSIVIAGCTGQGKTLMAEQLAEAINDQLGEDKYGTIMVHCNEMTQPHEVSRLIGAPASYVGYGDGTLLSPVMSNPYQVLIFDEIEKASRAVDDVVMSLLDRGSVMLAKPENGKMEVDARRCIVIFTTNLPVDEQQPRSMGFSSNRDKPRRAETRQEKQERYRTALVSGGMRPEVAGRFTGVLRTRELSDDDMVDIALLSIQRAAREYGITLEYVSPEIVQAIYDCSKSGFGGRNLNHVVQSSELGFFFAENAGCEGVWELHGDMENMRLVPKSGGGAAEQPADPADPVDPDGPAAPEEPADDRPVPPLTLSDGPDEPEGGDPLPWERDFQG